MAYEKADFWAAYGHYARLPDNTRFAGNVEVPTAPGYRNLSLLGHLVDYNPEVGIKLREHYVPRAYKPQAQRKAQMLVDYFIAQGVPLTGTETVVVIGGAFGWLGEALEDLVPGLEACSVDLSQYVQDKKAVSADDELIENIVASGFDHTLPNSVGEWLFNNLSDPSPRCRTPDRVVQTDLASNQARNAVRRLFQSNAVTRCITEEVWQLLTQEEKDRYTAAAASYGATLTHMVDGVII